MACNRPTTGRRGLNSFSGSSTSMDLPPLTNCGRIPLVFCGSCDRLINLFLRSSSPCKSHAKPHFIFKGHSRLCDWAKKMRRQARCSRLKRPAGTA